MPITYPEHHERRLRLAQRVAAQRLPAPWPWWLHELIEHFTDAAYTAGYQDGYAAADADLVAALTRALGGPDCPDYRTAVRRHHRLSDAKARRDEWDRTASRPRPDDHPGGPVDWDTGQPVTDWKEAA